LSPIGAETASTPSALSRARRQMLNGSSPCSLEALSGVPSRDPRPAQQPPRSDWRWQYQRQARPQTKQRSRRQLRPKPIVSLQVCGAYRGFVRSCQTFSVIEVKSLRRVPPWREIVGSSAGVGRSSTEACGVVEPLGATASSGQPPRSRGLVSRSAPTFLANDLVQLH
jgi:hypothetical protein